MPDSDRGEDPLGSCKEVEGRGKRREREKKRVDVSEEEIEVWRRRNRIVEEVRRSAEK
jgi:hypothetical protein